MTTHVELHRGAYHDSVSLMQVSRTVAGTPGVTAAQVAMATELNVDVLRGMGFDVPGEAGPNDLVVALRAADAQQACDDPAEGARGKGDQRQFDQRLRRHAQHHALHRREPFAFAMPQRPTA